MAHKHVVALAAIFALFAARPAPAQDNAAAAEGGPSAEAAAAAPAAEAAQPEPPRREREDPAMLEQQARQAYVDGDYLRFYIASLKLHKQMPYVPAYMVDLIRACALLDRQNTAYHYMLTMQQQGLSYDFNEVPDAAGLLGTQAYDYINNLMIEAGEPAGQAELAFSLPGSPADYLSLAWDASRERFLVGTEYEGRLLAVDAQGNSEELLRATPDNGLWSINGIAVDARANRLWLSTSASPRFAAFTTADRNRGSLVELELDSLQPVARYNMPVDALDHELGGLALTDDGHVYVIDSLHPMLYLRRPESSRLEPFLAAPNLVGFTDITVTPDNARVFVSDPVMGVLVIDPVAEQSTLLTGPETLNLAGIQGIAYRQGKLYIVQAGISPERVLRLDLDANGTAVASVTPMAIAQEFFSFPGSAAVQGDGLVYFANHGAVEDDATRLARTALDAGVPVKAQDVEDLKRLIHPATQ